MTEAENLQRALKAEHDLEMVADAYALTRIALLKAAETAESPEKAWAAILELRALDAVMKRLRDHVHTAKFDKVGKDQ